MKFLLSMLVSLWLKDAYGGGPTVQYLGSVPGNDVCQPRADVVHRFLPAHLLPLPAAGRNAALEREEHSVRMAESVRGVDALDAVVGNATAARG
jgi:hypothetical protein